MRSTRDLGQAAHVSHFEKIRKKEALPDAMAAFFRPGMSYRSPFAPIRDRVVRRLAFEHTWVVQIVRVLARIAPTALVACSFFTSLDNLAEDGKTSKPGRDGSASNDDGGSDSDDAASKTDEDGGTKPPADSGSNNPDSSSDATTSGSTLCWPNQNVTLLQDDFERLNLGMDWLDNEVHGNWRVGTRDQGIAGIETDGTRVFSQQPKAATTSTQSYSARTQTTQSFTGDLLLRFRMRTVSQLRTTGVQNSWETAWLEWHCGGTSTPLGYYFLLKRNGWEIGKHVSTGSGTYDEIFLASDTAPFASIGAWYTVEIRHVSNTISVCVDGKPLSKTATDTDTNNRFTSGVLCLWADNSVAHFDDIAVMRP